MTTPYINQHTSNPPKIEVQPLIATAHVEELMGNVPSWIVRWGITLVFCIIGVFIGASWLIHYPDIVKVDVLLTTEKPPIRVMPLTNGKINQFLVIDKQSVQEGALLAILDNTARFADVDTLDKWLSQALTDAPLSIEPPSGLQVGSLQNTYARLLQIYADLAYTSGENSNADKIENLEKQMQHTDKLKINYEEQRRTLDIELNTTQKEFNRYKKLDKRFISAAESEKLEAQIAQAKRQVMKIESDIINVDIEKRRLKEQIIGLSASKKNNLMDKTFDLKNILQTLMSEIQKWKQEYLLIAPISGQVTLSKTWSPQQSVRTDEEVMTIVPNRTNGIDNKIICKAILKVEEAGKVKTHQRVNIRLGGYPYQEFGILKATVIQIAPAPTKEGYPVDIMLEQSNQSATDILLTNSNKRILFRQELSGEGLIITDNRRIMSRIFDKLRAALHFD